MKEIKIIITHDGIRVNRKDALDDSLYKMICDILDENNLFEFKVFVENARILFKLNNNLKSLEWCG